MTPLDQSLLRLSQLAFGLGAGILGASANGMGVWTQGCSLKKCPGCSSLHTRSPVQGKWLNVVTLIGLAQRQPIPPARLTVSGGEPTDQADSVAALLMGFRAAFPRAELVLYTGLRWATLASRHAELVAMLDVAVTGPYVRSLPPTPLSGSCNQEVRLLTPRAERLYRGWQDWPLHALQLGRGTEDSLVTVGIPDTQRMDRAAKAVGVAAVSWDGTGIKEERA